MTENQAPDPAPVVDLRKIAELAGIRMNLWNQGAASMAYSDGCEGVTREHLERFAALYGFACWNAALAANPPNMQSFVRGALDSVFPAPEGAPAPSHTAAMEQALEALTVCRLTLSDHDLDGSIAEMDCKAAITTLRAALAVPAPQAPVAEVHENGGQKWARLLTDLPPGTMLYAQPVQASVEQWQPIKTAPKDGTPILISDGRFGNCVSWDEEFDWWAVDDNKIGPFRLRGPAPTHWMPLPAAPQTKEPTNDR